ncbi:TRAP transporter solute receptor, TAXI family [Alteribacillus persepolensis]|uniref:TRAP transporter solute receptor, TAXI family n=1 Tax=Alteribacillus persepolensis TaxID=568899 RepID=A0A1G8A9E1_9BACI|nr:TAXI family TRAP transporter solute-binding subunit [Alteribacillus persepolensis]SDH17582.1 TRAP transporter solute receptor, TAXI family [Alteribacillus persepolensis]
MKRLCLLLLAIFVTALATACAADENASSQEGSNGIVSLYTPGSGGLIYMLSAGVSQLYDRPDTELVTEATSGSSDIMQSLIERYESGTPAFGGLASATVSEVYNGEYDPIDSAHEELRGVSFLGYTTLHIITKEGSGIESLADLKGKKLGASPGAADTDLMMRLLEEQYGLTTNDYEYVPVGYADIQQGLEYGSIDVGVINGGVPAPLVQETESMADITFISVENEKLENFIEDHPYYGMNTIEDGTYESQSENIQTPTLQLMYVTHEGTDEEVVYDFVQTLFDKQEELINIHPTAADINEETILNGIDIPLHGGAETYYQEQRILEE